MVKMNIMGHDYTEYWTRSLAKAVTYRILIIILDFSVIYLLTRKFDIAFWFMAISNVYTSVAYYAHERIWNGISWGRKRASYVR